MPFAQITALGALTRDPLAKNLGTEKAVVSGSIAINRKVKGEDKVTFIDFKAFGKTADNIAKFFSKGAPIIIMGELEQERWDDKDTGEKRSKLTIIANRFDFAGGNKRSDESAPAPTDDEGRPRRQPTAPSAPASGDEDVPF